MERITSYSTPYVSVVRTSWSGRFAWWSRSVAHSSETTISGYTSIRFKPLRPMASGYLHGMRRGNSWRKPKHSLGRSPSIPSSWSSLHLTPSRQSHLEEISFSPLGKGTTSEHTTMHCTTTPYRTSAQGGESNQYWSLGWPVLVAARSSTGWYLLPVLVTSATSTGSHIPLLFLPWQPFAIAIPMIDTACTTTLPQGDKSTYIGQRADLYCSDDEAI